MGKILLLRHGQDEDNANLILNGRRDTPLTDLGREQAQNASRLLKNQKIDIIYSSPLLRAFQTARIVGDELILDIILYEDLVERDFGILTGKPYTDVMKYATKTLQTDQILFILEAQGLEDFPTAYQRAKNVLGEMKKRHADQTILLVAHGDINKMIQAVHYGWTWEESIRKPYFANAEVVELIF